MAIYLTHAETLRSAKTARYHALRAGPWLERFRASESRQAVAQMIDDMRGKYEAATINRTLGAVKKALSLAWERNLTHENYGLRIKRLKEDNSRDTTLTLKEVSAIAKHCSEPVQAAIWISLFTGCRRGEVLALTPMVTSARTRSPYARPTQRR